jgi:hypothetical protein
MGPKRMALRPEKSAALPLAGGVQASRPNGERRRTVDGAHMFNVDVRLPPAPT